MTKNISPSPIALYVSSLLVYHRQLPAATLWAAPQSIGIECAPTFAQRHHLPATAEVHSMSLATAVAVEHRLPIIIHTKPPLKGISTTAATKSMSSSHIRE